MYVDMKGSSSVFTLAKSSNDTFESNTIISNYAAHHTIINVTHNYWCACELYTKIVFILHAAYEYNITVNMATLYTSYKNRHIVLLNK